MNQQPPKVYNSIDTIGDKIKLAHADPSLEAGDRRLMASPEQAGNIHYQYQDILKDLDQLKAMLTTVGAPRAADMVKNLSQACEAIQAMMEEELAKPR